MDYPIMLLFMLGSLVLTFGVAMPLALAVGRRNRQKRLAKMATDLGATGAPREIQLAGEKRKTWAVEVRHQDALAEVTSRQRGNYEYLTVVLPGLPQPKVVLRRETRADRLGKRLRVNRELQTGDESFDARVYIESDESERVLKTTLGNPAVRAAVLALLDSGLLAVNLGAAGVTVTVTRSGTTKDPKVLQAAIERLSALRSALPPVDPGQLRPPGRARGDLLSLLAIIGFAAASAGFYLLPTGLVDYGSPALGSEQDRAFGLAFLAWVVLVPVTWLWVRGHSRSFRNLLLTVLLGAYPMVTFVPAVAFAVNAAADRGAATPKPVVVLKKKSSHSGKKDHSYLTVSSWRHPGSSIVLEVSRGVFKRFEVNDELVLGVRPGALGWEWIDRFEKAPATPEAVAAPAP